MAKAETAKYADIALKVEDEPAGSGTFAIICGLTARTFTRENQIDENEVPDCADESLPLQIEKGVRAAQHAVSGNGVYAKQSHTELLAWFNSGQTRLTQIEYLNASVAGDPQTEEGPAILASLNNTGEYGQNYTAEIELQFNGTPVLTVFP